MLTCRVDILSVLDPGPSVVVIFIDCMDFDTVFVSNVADRGLAVFGSGRFKLPILSIKRFVDPWFCVDLA